jgi:ketosteroid isomerase-like protein
VLPPNSDVITGRQAIQTFWQGAMHMGIAAAKLQTVEVEGHGNTAHEVGQYTLQGAGGQVLDTGKYVVIWQQEAGQWKIHRDIWNSSRPASGQ